MPGPSARLTWTWRYEPADAAATQPGEFPSQSDAESWLGEFWRDLSSEGVTEVYLISDGEEVYGPMPLGE
ncbi:MAG: hypothetical protein JWO63_1809 [Frankiales bacterium]|nr:hypothetical protein [Frankiales bacterium]